MSFATEQHLGFILLFIDTAVMLQQEDQLRPYIDWLRQMDLQGEKSSGRQRMGTNRSANTQIPLTTVSYPVNAHCPGSTCRSHIDLHEKKYCSMVIPFSLQTVE